MNDAVYYSIPVLMLMITDLDFHLKETKDQTERDWIAFRKQELEEMLAEKQE